MAAIHAVFLRPMDQFRVIQHVGGKKLYMWGNNDWRCVGWLTQESEVNHV